MIFNSIKVDRAAALLPHHRSAVHVPRGHHVGHGAPQGGQELRVRREVRRAAHHGRALQAGRQNCDRSVFSSRLLGVLRIKLSEFILNTRYDIVDLSQQGLA